MKLPERLIGLNADDQGAFARRNVEKASLEELLDALDLDPLGEWALLHITHELVQRGTEILAPIEARLVARPTRKAAYGLCEALIELFQKAPETESSIIRVLIQAGEEAMRVEANPFDATTLIVHLADCARLAERALPEARPLALAFLDRARHEPEPDRFAVREAAFLAGGEGGGSQ
ncbi:hypothetical protein [Corallococcus carmarthensis]|uniref:Uncharacterized protein n=1 Tax=Corallococcus carmarthensis TaxID=2316728 RepID=A0A3A8L0X4_9BACT|nr:hypothetical protein [Corallococcus carmarthensis]NOK15602.1 hypothetical protein [Corallococcus carmarthensis]RKH07894.1 hypothetical protein D7X32_00390 [Corallococcus carmarthensis]